MDFLIYKKEKVWDNNYDYLVSLYIVLLFIVHALQHYEFEIYLLFKIMSHIFVFLFQIILGIYMEDDKKDFSVLVDRSVKGSNISYD